ncbi:MAG: hypothetical protein RI945_305, partial [Candidatus Parcubacteria bacterium]
KNIQAGLFLYSDSHGGYFPTSLTELENSQTERLPVNANKTASWNSNKYNYVAYVDTAGGTGNVIGFHLITHLETNSPVLTGAAKCRGVAAGAALVPCIIAPAVSVQTPAAGGSVAEPADAAVAKLLQSERDIGGPSGGPSDTDINCATDVTACMYDLKS